MSAEMLTSHQSSVESSEGLSVTGSAVHAVEEHCLGLLSLPPALPQALGSALLHGTGHLDGVVSRSLSGSVTSISGPCACT